jgi:hypothetical protein
MWNCVQRDISKYKIVNCGKRGQKIRADWEKTIKDAKVLIGLQCHLRRRRRRRRRRKEKEEAVHTNTAVFS